MPQFVEGLADLSQMGVALHPASGMPIVCHEVSNVGGHEQVSSANRLLNIGHPLPEGYLQIGDRHLRIFEMLISVGKGGARLSGRFHLRQEYLGHFGLWQHKLALATKTKHQGEHVKKREPTTPASLLLRL